MKLYLIGHTFRYAAEQMQLSLFPEEAMEYVETPFGADCDGAVSALYTGKSWYTAVTTIHWQGRSARAVRRLAVRGAEDALLRQTVRQSYYLAAVQLLPVLPPWGALSGVRPSKLATRHLLDGGTRASADRMLRDVYFVTPERRALCLDASLATVDAVHRMAPRDVSLYIGIPFCPTRCTYCSFVSISTERSGALVAPFLEKLLEEIAYTGRLLAASGRTIRTVYLGGGTPTIFSAEQLRRLLDAVSTHFDLSRCIEFTVEGGRPDTLDAEKLQVLRRGGCTRISVNPQTMSDAVLARVGRRHTAADVIRCYHEAEDAGFTSINMDLIAGLPGDDAASFARSLEIALGLHPSNLTVHTLALKKGAALYANREGLPTAEEVTGMVAAANDALRGAGFSPYYLYRQKYMSGSFENVGWCRDRDACLYNIYMMEELHSIISLGGGGMSKVNLPGGKLERFHNPKYPQEYLSQFAGVLSQKDALFALLAESEV